MPLTCANNGRVDWIRTSDPRVPNAVLYQTEPQPDAREYVSRLLRVFQPSKLQMTTNPAHLPPERRRRGPPR